MLYQLNEISAIMSVNVQLYIAIWIDHTSMMLSKRVQVQKRTSRVIQLTWNRKTNETDVYHQTSRTQGRACCPAERISGACGVLYRSCSVSNQGAGIFRLWKFIELDVCYVYLSLFAFYFMKKVLKVEHQQQFNGR